jgi:Asp-tRNA(Asn)/Glu-tRNA(Gln) amidotransferase C subunit
MRGDEPGEPLPPDKVIANAPRSFADQFRVSRVLDTD